MKNKSSMGNIRVEIHDSVKKACAWCKKEMIHDATGRRKGTKYCSRVCYHDSVSSFHTEKAEQRIQGEKKSELSTYGKFFVVYIVSLFSGLVIMLLILLLINSRHNMTTSYNYTILLDNDQKEVVEEKLDDTVLIL